MWVFWTLLILAAVALLLVLATSLICFLMIFYAPRGKRRDAEAYPIPEGEIYEPFRDQMVEWIRWTRALPHRRLCLRSHDGLKLYGSYYEWKKGAPIEILFHGYRGSAERDLSGGVYRCFELGRNALIVDQRTAGESEGRVITFGVKESLDCQGWVELVVRQIDPDARIIITGISMGASTVLMASVMPLPSNVVGVLADCGFTSARAIIRKVMRDRRLPPDLLYPFVRLGARLFGRFDPDERSALDAMRQSRLPILFLHGSDDAFVPSAMSEENYEACTSERKQLALTEGAGHGLCFPVDMPGYFSTVRAFFEPLL